jgi:hypothetical protein
MENHQSDAAYRQRFTWCSIFVGVWIMGVPVFAQPSSIRITSPRSGAVVYSGSEMEVAVDASPSEFPSVGLSGDGPTSTWAAVVATPVAVRGSDKPPYRVAIKIPGEASPGIHTIFAFGARHRNASELVRSQEVQIDVERPDEPQEFRADQGFHLLDKVGDTSQLNMIATFADGSVVNLTRSSRNIYRVDPAGIVSVSREGLVRALAPGVARITIRNGHAEFVVRAQVAGPPLRQQVK